MRRSLKETTVAFLRSSQVLFAFFSVPHFGGTKCTHENTYESQMHKIQGK